MEIIQRVVSIGQPNILSRLLVGIEPRAFDCRTRRQQAYMMRLKKNLDYGSHVGRKLWCSYTLNSYPITQFSGKLKNKSLH
jgi:hypothetical protein